MNKIKKSKIILMSQNSNFLLRRILYLLSNQ